MASKEDQRKKRQSDDILERVKRESDVIGNSAMARTAERARDHLAARDAEGTDSAELWGTRVGRILAVIAFAGLAIWLYRFLTRGG